MHTLVSAHCTLNFLLSSTIPSFDIVSNALSASSLIAKETYPTPFDTPVPCSRTTNADLTGAMSENNVCKSVEVAVYGRLDTKNVDLAHYSAKKIAGKKSNWTDPWDRETSFSSSLAFRFPSVEDMHEGGGKKLTRRGDRL
jgi:hypothetical protein